VPRDVVDGAEVAAAVDDGEDTSLVFLDMGKDDDDDDGADVERRRSILDAVLMNGDSMMDTSRRD